LAKQDQKKWNSRYFRNIGSPTPSDILSKYLSFSPKGRALDIACGNGRNSKFLAQNGFKVDAVDISDVALRQLPDNDARINIICVDIDIWQIPQNRYELIINIRFLDRRLFPMIKKGLKPGGVLIFESFIDEKQDYCLEPNELLHAFNTFEIVYYEEKGNDPSDKFDRCVYMVAIKK
jgi:SAM-dependent methyltransferase